MVVSRYYYIQPTIPIPISIAAAAATTTTTSSVHRSPPTLPSLNFPNIAPVFGTTVSRIRDRPISVPILSRRPLLPSVSGIWDALTGGNDARQEALAAVRRGMMLFREGDVSGSVAEFDKAIERDPRQKAYLWQRGLSLYYLDRFEEGAEQFRLDVAQNPNDTEESIWCFLCEAQLYGVDEARRRFLEAEIRDLSCEKLITCSKMVVIRRSLLLHFQAARRVNTSMLGYMLASTMNHRAKQMQLKSTCLLPVSPHMVKGLVIIWLLLPRFTVYVEIGAPFDKQASSLVGYF
ncbi:uncharacterized protein LOC131326752 isoform X1 [Rhododendron vialii]|uniref:uncharacterized protein LOC131326752 isoform X1 n=1 Tax=Rhododendron vialii TaxID=182163 RepID=UPI002660153F|nr:uncharacterized protein LOC131326752 isoform X1 [Rhododendron vialii]